MTATAPRRFDDPAPPSSLAAAGSLMGARWGVCLAFIVASAIATIAATVVVLTGVVASAALEAAIAATPIAAVVASDTTAADTARIGVAIRALPEVAYATLRPKDDALRALTAAGTPVPDGRNPLPDVWVVVLNTGPIVRGAQTVAQSTATLRAALAHLPNVEAVRVDDRWLAPLADRTTQWKRAWPFVLDGFLFAVVVAVACCSGLAGAALSGNGSTNQASASKWVLAATALVAAVIANSAAAAAVYGALGAIPVEARAQVGVWLGRDEGLMTLTAIGLASVLVTIVGMTVAPRNDSRK